MQYLRANRLVLTMLGFIMISCSPRNIYAVPEDAIIRYAENGTPCFIKGENLSSNLDNDLRFRMLKREGLYEKIVYQFLISLDNLLKIDNPYRQFEVIEVKTDGLTYKHITLQQVHNGIPVWGSRIIVHLNQDNQVYLFQGHYESTLKNVETTPKLSAEEAGKRAIYETPDSKEGWRVQERKLFIFMQETRKTPRLAYRITLVRGLMHREYYFVDAGNGKILHKVSGTPRENSLSLPR